MSNKKDESEDLKAFEAALRALRPRTNRLDGRWRSQLVEMLPSPVGSEAAASLPSPVGRGVGGEGCEFSGGHQFVCIHCGSDAPVACGIRHWAWPAAFSTVTAVAAILLVMLVTRLEPQMAVPSSEKPKQGPVLEYGLAEANASRGPLVSGADEMPYLKLRDQVLRDGVESWKFPVSPVVTAAGTTEGPLSYREQLDRLLKQQGLRGS
jgi:hypothetical protein